MNLVLTGLRHTDLRVILRLVGDAAFNDLMVEEIQPLFVFTASLSYKTKNKIRLK